MSHPDVAVGSRLEKQELLAAPRLGLFLSVVLAGLVLAALAGCGFTGSAIAVEGPVSLRGTVRGGQQPVSGATVQLYATGTSGTASAAQPLLTNPVQSDSNGNFSIPASYRCPSASTQVYLIASGGTPGPSAAANPALALVAMLGSCSSLSASTPISVNEVTTVGSVWPLAPYMTSPIDLGSSPGDTAFLAAAASVSEFINIDKGSSPGAGTAESYFAQNSKLYSLADVLDKCVNSPGGSAGDGGPCGALFSMATPAGGSAPTDTLSAAMRIAQNPDKNVTDIFGLAAAPTAFQPTLTAAPADWTLTLSYAVATPSISLKTGTYVGNQEVTISDSTAGSKIYYTTDGTAPTSSSPIYAAPLSIGVSSTVQAIAILDGSQSAVASSTLTIAAAQLAARVAFLQQPSDAWTGAAISPAVRVAVEDAAGNMVPTATNRVTVNLAGGYGLGGTLEIAARNGVAIFSNLTVNTAGKGYALAASSPGLSPSTSTTFNVASPGITLSLPSSSINVGSTLTGNVTLAEPAGSGGVSVALASSSANDVSVSPSAFTIAAGQSTGSFTISGIAAGASTLSASATRYTPASAQMTAVPAAPVTNGPSVTTIEALGAIPASQAVNGLGFNITPGNEWEFQMAAAAGATHARYQCSWVSTENQTAPPNNTTASPQFTLQSDCEAGLASAADNGIHSTILAAFGSPYHQILTVTVPSGASAGATRISVAFASGVGGDTLSSMAAFYDTIISSSKVPITNKHSYAGGLITGVTITDPTHATITLASALSSALPANTATQYVINQYLYPPPASFSPTDASVLAYATYAEFLASKISLSGLAGEVEIWNEPPWPDDPWDDRYDFYDKQPVPVSPGPQTTYLPNWGFAVALYSQASPVAGVTYNWGGTEKTGGNSMLNAQMKANTGVSFAQPNTILTTESFHPYGNNPEQGLWSEPCLAASIRQYPALPSAFQPCNLFGNAGGNAALAVQDSLLQQSVNAAWGIGHNITETGFSSATGDDLHKARFIMRQFLGYQAAGVTPVQFYRLYDASADNFSFVNPTANTDGTHRPLPAYTAIAGLMADLAKIKSSPVTAYSAQTLPSIVSYSGTYPLDTVSMVGSRSGDRANSILFAIWQRSFTSGVWGTLTSPAPAPVTVNIPTGVNVVAVVNLDTRAAVSYTTSGQQITFNVSDDPVEVLVEP